MLPPDSTSPTRLPLKRSGCRISAASPAAPAPSTSVFSISSSISTACSMSPSSTSSRSSTWRRDDLARQHAGRAHGDAFGDGARCPAAWCVPCTALTIAGKRVVCTPTISMPGLRARAATRHAGDQAAAADRHHQRVEIGHRIEHLERHRALAGDDRFVVVGMDEGQPFALRQLPAHGRAPRRACRRAAPPRRRSRGCARSSRPA